MDLKVMWNPIAFMKMLRVPVMVRRVRRIYPYLCIDAHISTPRHMADGEMSTLPDSTVDAVITAGRTFLKEVKRQFGGVTPRVFTKVVRRTDNQPCRAPEEPDSTSEVTQTLEPPIALIAVNDDVDEFNTVSGASEEQHVQPSRRVVMRGTPTTETATARRVPDKFRFKIDRGQLSRLTRLPTTPKTPPHCMQFTGNASNTLACSDQSKRAHHDDKSGHHAVSATRLW